jgi:hypothetical protein
MQAFNKMTKPPDNTGKKYQTKLSPQQLNFIDIYTSKYGQITATEAAIRAGYARESAHTRAYELLNHKINPQVRHEIDRRLEDSRQAWTIDRDKGMAALWKTEREAEAKGLYGVKAKCIELRLKLAGLFIEKHMVATKELTEEEINLKWKELFNNRDEMELAHIDLMDEVWGTSKPKLKAPDKSKHDKAYVEMDKYQEQRKREREGRKD